MLIVLFLGFIVQNGIHSHCVTPQTALTMSDNAVC